MPVSSGLQKYFDSQQKKKSAGDVKKQFKNLAGNIDPAFLQSFAAFNSKIMSIVEENPDSLDIVSDEISELDTQLHNSLRVHDMKKAHSVIKATEEV